MPIPKAKLTKLILSELAAVPTGAQDVQGTAILKNKDGKAKKPTAVEKRSALTTSTEGHTHLLCGVDDCMAGTTTWESMNGSSSYSGHNHPWVRNEDGSITIGEVMGHTHAVDVMSASLAKSAVSDEKSAVSAKLSADAIAKSTRSGSMQQGQRTTEDTMSQTPDLAKQLADVTKSNERLERIAKMSGVHKAHYDTLTGEDADTFLAKSNADREVIVSEVAKRNEESNKVVYVSKSTGDVYKAKDDQRLVDMAKRMDEQFVTIEKANIRKQAAELLGGMPGSDDVHDLIVGSVLKSGASKEAIDEAIKCLKGMKETSSVGKKAAGVNPGNDPQPDDSDDALAKLEKGVVAFAKEKGITNVWTEGLDAFKQTPEGAELKRAYDESLGG